MAHTKYEHYAIFQQKKRQKHLNLCNEIMKNERNPTVLAFKLEISSYRQKRSLFTEVYRNVYMKGV